MFDAIRKDDAKEVKRHLSKGANPNATEANDWPVIVVAAGQSLDMVKLLLSKGAKIDARRGAQRASTEGKYSNARIWRSTREVAFAPAFSASREGCDRGFDLSNLKVLAIQAPHLSYELDEKDRNEEPAGQGH